MIKRNYKNIVSIIMAQSLLFNVCLSGAAMAYGATTDSQLRPAALAESARVVAVASNPAKITYSGFTRVKQGTAPARVLLERGQSRSFDKGQPFFVDPLKDPEGVDKVIRSGQIIIDDIEINGVKGGTATISISAAEGGKVMVSCAEISGLWERPLQPGSFIGIKTITQEYKTGRRVYGADEVSITYSASVTTNAQEATSIIGLTAEGKLFIKNQNEGQIRVSYNQYKYIGTPAVTATLKLAIALPVSAPAILAALPNMAESLLRRSGRRPIGVQYDKGPIPLRADEIRLGCSTGTISWSDTAHNFVVNDPMAGRAIYKLTEKLNSGQSEEDKVPVITRDGRKAAITIEAATKLALQRQLISTPLGFVENASPPAVAAPVLGETRMPLATASSI